MKRLFVFFSALFLLACQPEDNSLKTQSANPRAEGQVNSKNLRVGAYGLPIFAAQNLEQIGVLVSECLRSEAGEVIDSRRSPDLQEKKCRIRVHDQDRKGISTARERWEMNVVLRRSDHQLVSAKGEILSSMDYGQFRGDLVELQYFHKEFFMEINSATGELGVEILAYGETKSERSSLKFDYKLEAEGRERMGSATQWDFNNLQFDLKVRDSGGKIKNFQVSSRALQLSWKTPQCAEISGEAETMDRAKEKDKRSVRLNPKKAELVVSAGSPWSQSYQSCESRKGPIRNFEFMFY